MHELACFVSDLSFECTHLVLAVSFVIFVLLLVLPSLDEAGSFPALD